MLPGTSGGGSHRALPIDSVDREGKGLEGLFSVGGGNVYSGKRGRTISENLNSLA